MKKLVLLPIFLLFALAAFFSCTKDTQPPNAKDTNQSHILSMTKGEDGILNLTISAGPSAGGAVGDRDGCTMYEAMRFTEINPLNGHPDPALRCSIDVKFRLVKIENTTLDRTALTGYTTVSNVGGLNISWYDVSPLSDYSYATEYNYCVRTPSSVGSGDFAISEFWSDDQLIQLYPWICDYRDAADFIPGPIPPDSDKAFQKFTLESDCDITPEMPPCFFPL
jgi:hypothetical protein